jgi:hypothetical protein
MQPTPVKMSTMFAFSEEISENMVNDHLFNTKDQVTIPQDFVALQSRSLGFLPMLTHTLISQKPNGTNVYLGGAYLSVQVSSYFLTFPSRESSPFFLLKVLLRLCQRRSWDILRPVGLSFTGRSNAYVMWSTFRGTHASNLVQSRTWTCMLEFDRRKYRKNENTGDGRQGIVRMGILYSHVAHTSSHFSKKSISPLKGNYLCRKAIICSQWSRNCYKVNQRSDQKQLDLPFQF